MGRAVGRVSWGGGGVQVGQFGVVGGGWDGKVGFKDSVGVLHRLGGEGWYGQGKKFSGAFGGTICMAGSY